MNMRKAGNVISGIVVAVLPRALGIDWRMTGWKFVNKKQKIVNKIPKYVKIFFL